MTSPIGGNRINIPAVCRICRASTGLTAGTGVLVGAGVILTSRYAVGATASEAAAFSAVFFEGTKKRVAEVRLLPHKYFFTAMYPEHMDYCLVACEEGPLLNVTPVHVPLTQREWTVVCEGDVVLVVQHPINDGSGNDTDGELAETHEDGERAAEVAGVVNRSSASTEPVAATNSTMASFDASNLALKTFDEVLRCREDLYYLKTNGLTCTAGCPVFNDLGELIGLQCQRQGVDGDGMINRILSVVAIVRHLFAMKQLSVLPQQQLARPDAFDDIWATWYTKMDIARIYTILANFRGRDTVREVTRRLCEITAKASGALNSQEDAGAVRIILTNLKLFPGDEELAELGLRALWRVSVGTSPVLEAIAAEDGVQAVVDLMKGFPNSEEIIQLGVVMLCNMADAGVDVFAQNHIGEHLLVLLLAATRRFAESTVLQKFGLAMLTRLLRWERQQTLGVVAQNIGASAVTTALPFAVQMVEAGMLDHVGFLLTRSPQAQVFLVERALEFVGELVQDRKAVELSRQLKSSVASGGVNIVDVAAGSGGTDVKCRYPVAQLVDILIEVMKANVDNDTIMVSGNTALWGFGNVPEYRAAILLNPESQEVLRLSIPSLMASTK